MTAHPDIQELARILLAREGLDQNSADGNLRASIAVCEKLRQPLVTFAGAEGYRSLLSRTLTLARVKEPSLSALKINMNGAIQFTEDNPLPHPSVYGDAEILLVAQLLSLLATFIGQSLTLQLVQRTWPDLNELQGGGEKNNE